VIEESVCVLTAVYANQAQKVQSLPSAGASSSIDTSALPPRGACTLELCAGIVDKDVAVEEIAREELLEEVGYDVPISKLEKVVRSRSDGVSNSLEEWYSMQGLCRTDFSYHMPYILN